ncbi:MAG: M20/M25/M40 family metallo-hydrolase, partial [Candidatus Methanofastidiosia archaeon]
AIDNGSGVAAMLEIARMMVKRPHEATLVFVAFSGEEEGLFGSEEYVRKHLSEMPQVLGMICLDGIGGGERIVIGMTGYRKYATTEELDSQVKKLAALLGYTTLTESFESGTSDYASFTAQGVPSTLIYSSPLDRIHTLEDTYENVNWELLRDATVIGAASVYALSNGELSKVSNIVAPNPFLVIGGSVLLIFLPIGILFYYKKKLNLRVEGIILVGILSFLIVMVFDLMLFRRWFAIWFSSLLKSAGLENPLENFYLPSNVSDAIIFIVLILITYFILTSLRDLFRTQSAQEKRYDWGVTESTSPMNTHTILEAGPTALTLALKNLSRRKLRTLLTITSVGVTLSAFLLFVQVSHDVELFVTTQEISIPINAVTIQGQRISSTRTLIPLPIANFIEEEYGQNTQVLKRLSIGALGKTIVSEKTSRFLSAIIGIDPKLERETTFMDGIVVEGKFLLDISRLVGNPILLSKPLAQELGVGVSDEVRIGDRRFDVFGIFSEEKLEKLKDVDGDSLLPLVPGGVGMEAGISTLAEPRYTVIVPLHVAQSEYYPTLSKLI